MENQMKTQLHMLLMLVMMKMSALSMHPTMTKEVRLTAVD